MLFYLCRENKGADQLCAYCAADLHLCFSICKMQVFNDAAHVVTHIVHSMHHVVLLVLLHDVMYRITAMS